MLGALLEGGEGAYGRSPILERWIVDVEEKGEIALDDEWFAFGHIR